MENNLNNLPPFYVGQKVVCVKQNRTKTIKLNTIYTIKSLLKTTCCNIWIVDVGIRTDYEYTDCSCGATIKNDDCFLPERFKPLQESVFPSLTMSKVLEKESQLISMN